MKKLRSQQGFTLVEMLISILLLAFVSLLVTAMTSAIFNTNVTMKEVAQAEVLGSEAFDNVRAQLLFAQNVKVEDGKITFDQNNANKGYTLGVKEGRIVLTHTEDGAQVDELLFAGSTYGNLSVQSLDFVVEDDAVIVSIAVSLGDKTLWGSSMSVKPLNGILPA